MCPETVFKVDMRDDLAFCEKNEFVEFRAAVRRIKNSTPHELPKTTLTVQLPFIVQRSLHSFTKDLRQFTTSYSTILDRDRKKNEFHSLKAMAECMKTTDHKTYFMILRFTGVEIHEEDRHDKKSRCVQDCDDDSSQSFVEYSSSLKHNYKDKLNKDDYYEHLKRSVYVPQSKRSKRRR